MKKIVENQIDKGFASNTDSSKSDSDDCMRQQRKTDATELALRLPWWFRLLLKVPQLPSIMWLPDFTGLICYLMLPMAVLGSYIIAFVYIVLLVHSPLVYVLVTIAIFPLWLVATSAKAHVFWNYYQLLVERRTWDIEKSLDEYIRMLKKKQSS